MPMAKHVLASAAIFALILLNGFGAHAENAGPNEYIKGHKDAPVVIEEYADLTCSHCADFTEKVLPELEKKYIETGKVRFVFHPFPLNGISLKATALAHCMPKDQYFAFLNVLFKNMKQWALNSKPEATIVQYAKLGGLAEDKANACLVDTKILDMLVAERTKAQEKYDISSTPTFIFNGGEDKLVGARSLEEFSAMIDKLLAKKK